ncbi:unnamed protein product, partial [Symbiodinium pilosum]
LPVNTGGFFLFEHPEPLGTVKTGDVPGSVWDFPNMRSLIESTQSATWGIHQCFFGSETPKPTRLGSNLPEALRFGQCWHILDESGKYLGPLGMCPHNHDVALIGRDEAGWKTSAAAAYPPLFCEYLARLIFSATTGIQSVAESWAASHVHPAEALSQVLLQANQTPLPEDILAVFELLPHTRAHPGTGDSDPGKAFFAGANWEQAGFIVRDNTFSFPSSCQLICKFIQSVSRSHHFAAFVILKEVKSACHRDLRNADYPNLVYALSKFSGGGVWQQAEQGTEWRFFLDTWMCGEVLPLQPGPALVHARARYHATVQDAPIGGQQVQQVQQAQVASQEASQASRLEQQGCQAFGSPQEVEVISSGDEHQKGALQVQSEEREEPFNPTLSGSFGQPMICRFEMCKREIVDGFGLCSPGRWTPAARERLADSVQSGHAREIRGILERFVHEQLGDVKKFAFMLATGKVSCSPFSDEALSSLRRSIAATLGDPAGALEVPERQPFYLYMLAQSLQILGDPDWEILTQGEECYANGVPLGHDRPLPRTPQ